MIELFFSYSHEDEDLRNQLELHLVPLRRQGIISVWHDRRIIAGDELHGEISDHLESAKIILVLISAHFLASDYCYDRELKRALEKHRENSARVIPVILHPCDWQHSPVAELRATPPDGKPISKFANLQEAFAIVAKDIREAAEAMAEPIISRPQATIDHTQSIAPTPTPPRSSNLRVKRTFDDRERDEFLEDSFGYMVRYFEESLNELSKRNENIATRSKRYGSTSFTAAIYDRGKCVAECSIWLGQGGFSSTGIYYSNSPDPDHGSFNESLYVHDDGFALQLKPMGLRMFSGGPPNEPLSAEGAAEYYWSMLIEPLQR